MANTLLTSDVITNEAQRILHQKLNFIGSINRQYDDQFAKSGAKIGNNLRVRMPNQFQIRKGRTYVGQATVNKYVDLPTKEQYGVDMEFFSDELALSLDKFSENYIAPAMSVLAANLEADFLSAVTKDVYNIVDSDGQGIDMADIGLAEQILTDNLSPEDMRTVLLSTKHNRQLISANSTLFNAQTSIAEQYKTGMMGHAAGFDFRRSTFVNPHTTGTAAKTTGYLVNGATQTGSTLTVDGGTTTLLIGDVITLTGVYRVHPETKVSTGELQQFVVTANSGASATSLKISPEIVSAGAYKNVTSSPADNAPIVKVGAGASELLTGSIAYHKDAFTFATADLPMPGGMDMTARKVFEGISMRFVRGFDIKADEFVSRFDILPAWASLRPQLACRIHADG